MFSKAICAILLSIQTCRSHTVYHWQPISLISVFVGVLGAPAGHAVERDCRSGLGQGCLRDAPDVVERDVLESLVGWTAYTTTWTHAIGDRFIGFHGAILIIKRSDPPWHLQRARDVFRVIGYIVVIILVNLPTDISSPHGHQPPTVPVHQKSQFRSFVVHNTLSVFRDRRVR